MTKVSYWLFIEIIISFLLYYNIRKNILWLFFFDNYLFQMLAAATSQMVQPLSLICDDSLEHFDW